MKCYSCGKNGVVKKCDTCGEVRCGSGQCTGASGKKGSASTGGRCKSCKKGKYVKIG